MFDPHTFLTAASLTHVVMANRFLWPMAGLFAVSLPSVDAVVAVLATVGLGWKIVRKKLSEATDDDSDCRGELRTARREVRELTEELRDSERRRRHAEQIAEERKARIEILDRYLDDEGDRHPRDRGDDHDRP